MAGGKLSPRQKMINMMYLVLTALLALNVSKDILKAFHLVEVSMSKAGKNIDQKNADLMSVFAKQAANQPEKVGPYYDKAKKAVAINDEFVKYVQALRVQVENGAGGRKNGEADAELVENDNIEKHANLFMNEGKGKELRAKVEKTRTDLLALVDESERKLIKSDLKVEDVNKGGEAQTWESELFEHSPAAAVVTMLTKIENDCKNTTAEVLTALAKSITKDDRTFDKVEAKIIPKSTFVMSGGKFEADIMLVAYDSKQDNDIIIGGATMKPVNGIAHYEEGASGQGERTVAGKIMLKTKDGTTPVDFSTTYTVYTGAATVSAEAMNVLYIGLDNPISISVPGFPPDKIVASMSGGNLAKKSGNSYIAKVTQRGTAKINVTVKMEDGSSKSMGSAEFRVRSIPKPEAKLGGLSSGDIQTAGAIKANATRVFGSLGEGFAFEGVKYNVTKFTLVHSPKRGDAQAVNCSGNVLNPQAQSLIGKLKAGDKIIIDMIEAQGPDGVRKLQPVVITAR